ncbi:MAG: lipoprotein signal peptidase [Gammaproteobacteria bacterium]|nr:lipoprotein signal peptidase [Gammaproteobacteria bacterium]
MRKFLWIAGIVLVLDQLTKFIAADYLASRGEVQLASFFSFVLVHNTGAAFGILSSAGGWQNIFFITLAAIACVVIFWMFWRLNSQDIFLAVSLMLILGGAMGNLVDRLIHGHVIDFIDVYYRSWHWPAFNIADSAITAGAIILGIDAFRSKSQTK